MSECPEYTRGDCRLRPEDYGLDLCDQGEDDPDICYRFQHTRADAAETRLTDYERYGVLPPYTAEFKSVLCPTCGMPAAWTHPTVFASLAVRNDDYQTERARADALEAEVERLKERVRVESNEAMCQKARADHFEAEAAASREGLRLANADARDLAKLAREEWSALGKSVALVKSMVPVRLPEWALVTALEALASEEPAALAAHEKRRKEADGD